MEIPIITSFINGLKLFLENKRLRWLTIVFLVGLVVTSLVGAIGLYLAQIGFNIAAIIISVVIWGGIWPVFFLFATIMTAIRLQRFVASEESYKRSALIFLIWVGISVVMLFMFAIMFLAFFQILIFGVAFIGWITFQAYFSTRTALKYGGTVDTTRIPKGQTILSGLSNILCYFVIFGALVFVVMNNLTELLSVPLRLVLIIIGAGFAALFNFINSLLMARQRNNATIGNLALIGLFISFYSAYFIYNAGKPVDTSPDLVSLAISIFFVIYTMSSVGSTLSGRSSESRFRVSPDLAATFTFFLASGYYFADVLLPITSADPAFGASIADILKLMIFPFIAMIMELLYLRRIGKAPPAPIPEEPVSEPPTEEPIVPESEEPSEAPLPGDVPHTGEEPEEPEGEALPEELAGDVPHTGEEPEDSEFDNE